MIAGFDNMAKVLLSSQNLCIGYDSSLIENANFEIKEGDVIALLGPSGIGKTTLLRTIFGAVEPLEGSIVSNIERRGDLGFIPQRLGLIGNMSVESNVLNGVRVKRPWYQSLTLGLSSTAKKEVSTAISSLGLKEQSEQLVRTLSGGQQRRVATARTLAQNPKLILADEFLGELDEDNIELVLSSIKQMLEANNSAILMVEHHEEIAQKVANKIWRIENKTLIEQDVGDAFEEVSI